jgi:hypothetical protein
MPAISTILSGEIKAAAEAFFSTELSDVELHFDRLPAALDAVAFARGNHVHLDAEPSGVFSRRDLEILGHELTHVIQQRQGRVEANLTIHGIPANQDPALEAEAEEMGRRFSYGGPSLLPRLPLSQSHPPILQRFLSVGGKLYSALPPMTAKGSAVLKLIRGGEDWLKWVTGSPSVHYQFADESQLLQGIQAGLHGTDLLLLQRTGILLHPAKLQELSEDELKVVLEVETASADNSVADMQARKALAANGLLSQSELKCADEFLQRLGEKNPPGSEESPPGSLKIPPVFQAMTLADRIALFNLHDNASAAGRNLMLQKEAWTFALNFAQSPLEFVDYYQFYLSTVQDADPQPNQAGKRACLAEASAEGIGSLLYNLLWCPSVRGVPSPNEIAAIAQTWRAGGNRMGFSRFSSALLQIGQNAGLQGAAGEAAQKIIDQFMEKVQNAVLQQTPVSVKLSQDGNNRYYQYPLQCIVAELGLSADGNLTLSSLRAQK